MPRRRVTFLCLSVLIFLFSGSIVAAFDGTDPIVTTDLLKLKTMSGIDLSPDGKRAVFVLTSIEKNKNGDADTLRHLWQIDFESDSVPSALTFGKRNDSSPVWSPDSTRIAFVRRVDGRPQIWILPLRGGEAFPVTAAEFGAGGPVWSPDGRKLLYSSWIPDWKIDGEAAWVYERPGRMRGDAPNWRRLEEKGSGDKNPPGIQPDPDGTMAQIRAWLAKNAAADNPRVFTRLNLQGELQLQTGLRFSHVFVIEARPGAEAVQLTRGPQSFSSPSWSPDGQLIVCGSRPGDSHPDRIQDGDLWIVPAAGGEPRRLLDWPGYQVGAPAFSPDGTRILFSASDLKHPGYAERRLAWVAAQGGEPAPLTFDFDRSVGSSRWSPDGRWILFTAADRGAFPLFRVPSMGGAVEPLVKGPVGVHDFDLASGRMVYALTEVATPLELYTADREGRNSRRLTSFNSEWLSSKRVVQPREFMVERPDGRRIQAWVMEPADRVPGRTYPLALEIHGGPSSMWGPGELSMWHEFQLLCARGYGVVYCNPRGSGGYGFDFRHANYRDWGHGPAGDILAAASTAAELDWVDRDRQVVTGGSYAGYMTAWIVTQDHRFRAAVAQRGVYDLSTFFGEGRAWQLVPNHFGGFPWDKEARPHLDANSPQSYVSDIRTPLLIIHSDNDIRTGVIQSEMLYKSLKQMGRPVEYVRYPNEGHELSRSGDPLRRMDRLNRILEFFERFISR